VSNAKFLLVVGGGGGGSTYILNFVELTKTVKMPPDFRSEILSTTNPTWTVLGSN